MNEMAENTVVNRMTISEFSAASRLSAKALRLYDALGLLEPAWIDPSSNYRYYSGNQLERASRIALLRQLEMPLNRIAQILELEGKPASAALLRFWKEIEQGHREKRQLVQYLEQTLEGRGIPMFTIQTRQISEQKVATVQRHVFVDGLSAFIGENMAAIFAQLQMQNAKPAGVPFVIYHGKIDADSNGPAEICIPFSGTLEPVGEMRVRLEPAHQEAFTVMPKGSVKGPELMHAYDAVGAWIRENAAYKGSPREVYFADWNAVADHEPAFDVAFPF